ncbi:hypothetical protein XELAEV_18041352mg [Xenopus laevis]|uniref:Iodothyronine deiodinase n=1 Tax=Xenopus laevis TaxID=8355 RepID=A0A974C207_XENLA|nr:hypothetical protein XELAEV_18041352mg [Xenopus laevis]
MGLLSVDLLITLQILPGFFSNCLFLALYDSVVLVKHVLLQLNRSKSSQSQWRRMLTPEGLRCVWNSFLLDAYKQVKLGQDAPNSNVIQVSNRNTKSAQRKVSGKCHLLDFASSERPLVFSSVANFVLVYIDEAHPSDGWAAPGTTSYEVKKHRNQEERCAAASKLLEYFSIPPQCQVVADCMDNNANVAYGVSFERVCIVQRQKIVYLGGKGPFFYNIQEIRRWLELSFGKR